MTNRPSIALGASYGFRTLLTVGAAVLITGCDGLFDVENPTNLLDEDLSTPLLEATLSNSAEGNLAHPISYIMEQGALLSDTKYFLGLQFWSVTVELGYRDRPINVVEEPYLGLAAGVWIADDMVRRLEPMVDSPQTHLGIANSYFWGAVGRMTLSSYYREMAIEPTGELVTPVVAIESAIDRFEKAAQIANAAGDSNLEAGAYGALARAHRSLYYEPIAMGGTGDPSHFQQAEEWARRALETSDDYRVAIRFGSPGTTNQAVGGYSLHPKYTYLKDPVSGNLEPRVRHESPRTSVDGIVTLRELKYYPNNYAPLPISRAAEAELIIAEARHLAGDLGGAIDFINRVRARSGLPAFSSSVSSEVRTQLRYEREVELIQEGRRWEDMRYYNILPEEWDEVNKREGMAKRWPPAPPGAASGTAPTTG